MDLSFATLVVSTLALLVLVLIAAELALLRRDFAALPGLLRNAEEKKESPTINVNVGTLPPKAEEGTKAAAEAAPAGGQVLAVQAQAGQGQEATAPAQAPASAAAPAAEVRPPEPAPPPRPEPLVARPVVKQQASVTSGGFGVVKCPKCGAENTSFRSECFNCNTGLK